MFNNNNNNNNKIIVKSNNDTQRDASAETHATRSDRKNWLLLGCGKSCDAKLLVPEAPSKEPSTRKKMEKFAVSYRLYLT